MKLGRANLDEFGATVLALAEKDRDVLVVTSDSRGSGKLTPFGKALPDQIVEVGIAEQNLVGIAAGLTAAGKRCLPVSASLFSDGALLEQIGRRCLLLELAGEADRHQRRGELRRAFGSTHHSLHDFAVLRYPQRHRRLCRTTLRRGRR